MCNKAVRVLMLKTRKQPLLTFSGLQMFADTGGDEGDDDSDDDDDPDDDSDSDDDSVKTDSFDDFLKQEGNQAEFDKRVREAVSAAISKEQKKWKTLTDDKLSEAEKLAKMSKDERAEYLRRKEREEFEAEKAEFEKEKLLVEVNKELQEQNLPTAFAKALVSISDAEMIKKAISEIKETWDAEITEAVKAKARQTTPREGGDIIRGSNGLSAIRKMARENRIIKN